MVGVRVAYFQHIYNSITSLPDQTFMLLRNDGNVILRYPDPKDRGGEKMPKDRNGTVWFRKAVGRIDRPVTSTAPHASSAVRPLSHYPLVINVGISETAALAGWRNHALTIGIGTLLVIICSILFFFGH